MPNRCDVTDAHADDTPAAVLQVRVHLPLASPDTDRIIEILRSLLAPGTPDHDPPVTS